jgi:hypothetical protein
MNIQVMLIVFKKTCIFFLQKKKIERIPAFFNYRIVVLFKNSKLAILKYFLRLNF